MSDTQKDIERLADINDHLRRQLDKSNEIVVELNHMVAKQAGEIATLRQQVAELQAWKANVPVKALNRMMTVAPFDSVEADIVWKWLKFSR